MSFALWVMLLAADGGASVPDGGAATATPPRNQGVVARQWQQQRVPSTGLAQSIGGYSLGCLQGGATLPASGPGYEALRLGRNRRFGHPALVSYIQRLAVAATAAKTGLLLVGDLSQPRGGPTPSGHRSHQSGLDVDLGYGAPATARAGHLSAHLRERLSPLAVVNLKSHQTTGAWRPSIVTLLALAASDPAVDRIFVNPAIKQRLCENPASAAASWQSRLRPWWAHHDHFHVRLKCPSDSPLCLPQEPPADNGCGATLAWWFSDDAEAARGKKKQSESVEPEPELPPACAEVLQAKP